MTKGTVIATFPVSGSSYAMVLEDAGRKARMLGLGNRIPYEVSVGVLSERSAQTSGSGEYAYVVWNAEATVRVSESGA